MLYEVITFTVIVVDKRETMPIKQRNTVGINRNRSIFNLLFGAFSIFILATHICRITSYNVCYTKLLRSISETLLWPAVKRFCEKYPEINIEINAENRLTDIVTERFDAGVRMGDQIAQDMIAAKISPEVRFAVVCSPEYLKKRNVPQVPADLLEHECINLRLNSLGANYVWEFSKDETVTNIRVKGQFTFNTTHQLINAALDGFGFIYILEMQAAPYIANNQLVRVLGNWCPPQAPFYLYYPSRHQHREAFRLFVDEIRYIE